MPLSSIQDIPGQSGAGMLDFFRFDGSVPGQWLHVLDCVPQDVKTAARAHGKRSAGARAAVASTIPDGNHGDNISELPMRQ